jgi:hypothetical protein
LTQHIRLALLENEFVAKTQPLRIGKKRGRIVTGSLHRTPGIAERPSLLISSEGSLNSKKRTGCCVQVLVFVLRSALNLIMHENEKMKS